ncbi:MAG: NMD3-related protein [Candidatus Aenigmatarchaeota archaeon]
MFCPKCGKEAELIDGFCRECFLKRTTLIEANNKFVRCSICGKWLAKGAWKKFDEAVKDSLKFKGELLDFSVTDTGRRFIVDYTLEFVGIIFEGTLEIHPSIRKFACTNCSRERGGYYESIIQLRGDWQKAYDLSNRLGTSKIEMKKEGVDLYVIKFSEGNKFISAMKKTFEPEVKESSSMAGMKDGRQISRKTIMLRFKPEI